MALLKESEVKFTKLRLNFKKVYDEISKECDVMPVGNSSPFMAFGPYPDKDEKNVFETEKYLKALDTLCNKFDITRNQIYQTYGYKHYTSEDIDHPMFKDAKEDMKKFFTKELITSKPQIIFIIGEWSKKLFEKTFRITIENGLNDVVLPVRVDGQQLEYKVSLYDISNNKDEDLILDKIKKIKIDWQFVHLHCHNSLSLKDGIGVPETRIQYAIDNNKPAIATTNHGSIADWINIYNGAKDNGMKPILGVEAYFNRNAEELRIALKEEGKEATHKRKVLKKNNNHMTLLVKNGAGYKNLLKVQNDAWLNGFYFNPIISPDVLKKNSEGIIVLSGCANGEQNKIILQKHYLLSDQRLDDIQGLIDSKIKSMRGLFRTKNDEKYADDEYLDQFDFEYFYNHQEEKKLNEEEYKVYALEEIKKSDIEQIENADKRINNIVDWWHGIFKDDYYLEIMPIDWPPQKIVNEELIKISKAKNIPLALTNDAHYINKAEAKVQELQMLSSQSKTFEDLENDTTGKIWTIKGEEFYFKTVDELYEAWEKWHKSDIFTEEVFWASINGTIEVVNKVEKYEIDTSPKLPKLYDDPTSILAKKIALGIKRRYPNGMDDQHIERAKYEFKIITDKGFADYFLIMEDIIMWAKNKFGPTTVGPGRGSAAGSLVSYLIGVTDVDPIPFNLLFERFLDVARNDVVDIDTDFETRIRDEVLEYIIQRFGREYVVPIGTFGVLQTRSALLDVGRVHGIDVGETFAVTKKLDPEVDAGDYPTIEDVEVRYPELTAYLDRHEKRLGVNLRFFINRIRGSHRQMSQHACGVLITSEKLTESVALGRANKGLITSWTEGSLGSQLSSLGFYKFDILGLNNLQVINDTTKLIEQRHGVKINWDDVDVNEKFVYDNTVHGDDHYGIFQFESGWVQKIIRNILPDNFEELSAISAILRPGPLKMGVHNTFADRKHNRLVKGVDYNIPECIADILNPTQGLIVYQEQFMLIANKIGGLDKAQMNQFRKQIVKLGKSKRGTPEYEAVMSKYHTKFIESASKPEFLGDKLEAERLWDEIVSFSAYGFNKSHSISYTMLSFREYWLKTYYDTEFNLSLLNNTSKGKETKGQNMIAYYISEMIKKGYKIIGPDINKSENEFVSVDKNEIVWGLGWVKSLPDNSINALIEERNKNGIFTSIDDIFERMDKKVMNKRAIDSLIYSGALDMFGDRDELSNIIYGEIRQDKKYKDIKLTQKQIIEKEINFCSISLMEIKTIAEIKKRISNELNQEIDSLSDVDSEGKYTIVAKVEATMNKVTKTKKDYIMVSLMDETKILQRIFVWPWKCKNMHGLKKGMLIVGKIEIENDFTNLTSFWDAEEI